MWTSLMLTIIYPLYTYNIHWLLHLISAPTTEFSSKIDGVFILNCVNSSIQKSYSKQSIILRDIEKMIFPSLFYFLQSLRKELLLIFCQGINERLSPPHPYLTEVSIYLGERGYARCVTLRNNLRTSFTISRDPNS